jgi:hypothetical protein
MGLFQEKRTAGESDLVYSDRTFRAYFNAGLATEALVGLYRLRFTIDHLENLSRASSYAFLVTNTFVFIYNYFKHGSPPKVRFF